MNAAQKMAARAGPVGPNLSAWVVMALTPLFFSTNVIFGRVAVETISPFMLAFLRWSLVCLILLPVCWTEIRRHRAPLKSHRRLLFLMGFLAQFICGALLYLALTYTTATNGILIYTSVPAIIILIERLFYGRRVVPREIAGIALATLGILVIIMPGSLLIALQFRFNPGDLLVLLASVAWAFYSIWLRRPVFQAMGNASVLCVTAICGTALLFPFAMVELAVTQSFPTSWTQWQSIAGIVLISSLMAFLGYQFGVRRIGAALASVFMYLLPVYGIVLSALFLGETIHAFHLIGTILVMSGVIIATAPENMMTRAKSYILPKRKTAVGVKTGSQTQKK